MPPFYYYYSNYLCVPPVAHTADMKNIPTPSSSPCNYVDYSTDRIALSI